ncbi:MAG: cytochrome C oxidase Cbb3 [Anaerotardibacter sp.]
MEKLDNIIITALSFIKERKAYGIHLLKVFLVLFALSFALESTLFNMNYYRSLSYDQICLDEELTLQETEDHTSYKLTENQSFIEFHGLNTELENIYLEFDSNQPAQKVQVSITFTDSAHSTYFYSTEYTEGVPVTDVLTNVEQSKYLYLNASGYVDSLRIEFTGENLQYPILLNSVSINKPQPFDFNTTRFFVFLFVLLLLYVFRPKSSIYSCFITERPLKSKVCICIATAIEIVIITSYLLLGSNLVGVATENYNNGSWDGKSIVNTYEVGGDNAQQYAELAKAMADGQLYLEIDPPEWLVNMDNPYDKGARDELQKETGEEYLFDVAYYEGHYYVYFGVVPVLLFYLPFYLLFGSNFPTAIGVLIGIIMFMLGCTALLDRFARYHFKRVSLGLFLLLQIPLIFCSGILYLAKFPTFYSLPISLAMAFVVWGLYFWMRGRSSDNAWGWYLIGSLCMAIVVGCRPQFLVFSLLAFPLFWRKFITEGHIRTKKGFKEFVCLLLPYFIVAAGIMMYNKARFGSLTDFGANYNLTVNDMTARGTNPGRFLPALFAYFFQTPNTVGVFPWIQAVDFETTYLGQTIKEVTYGGIFACLPILWILVFSKRILKYRFRVRSTNTIAGVVCVMLISGVVVALLDAQAAGILQRYYADFSFMFLISAVLLAFIVNEAFRNDNENYNFFIRALLVLAGISVLYSFLLCWVPETGWVSDIYPWVYQDVIEMFNFWT